MAEDLEMATLAPETKEVVVHKGICILVCHTGGEHFAIENRCTHQDTALHEGRMRNGFISCPLHGVRFELKTGEPRGDLTRIPVRTFPVETEGDRLRVRVSES